jgi:sensor histidine kinase YesM
MLHFFCSVASTLDGTGIVSFLETTVTSSLLSLIFQASVAYPSVYVSSILGIILAPYAVIQQNKLTQVEALDQTNDRLEKEVAQLDLENQRLRKQVQEIEETVLRYVCILNLSDDGDGDGCCTGTSLFTTA